MKNELLAIAIPTYNRADMLRDNLMYMMPEIKMHEIPVYISDDSNNDDTCIMIDAIRQDYPHIFYIRNSPGLGHDLNYVKTIGMTFEQYAWYLGDSMHIKQGGITEILNLLAHHNVDFVAVNAVNRKVDLLPGVFTDGRQLLMNLGWHLTLTGATILSQNAISQAQGLDVAKYKNFPLTATVFTHFAAGSSSLLWTGKAFIEADKRKKSYWLQKVFEVFLHDWINLIKNLPTYYDGVKSQTYALHARHTKLFSIKNLLYYRYMGALTPSSVRSYAAMLRLASDQQLFVMYGISLVPRWMLTILVKFGKKANA